MSKLMQVLTAAVVLSVPVLAICAFAPVEGTANTVAITPGDAVVVTVPVNVKKPTTPATEAGEAAPEVLAERWISTGGGKGGSGSPKG